MIISVIGGSKAKPEHLELAEAVGRELAKRQVMVACGGLSGVMEAVCRGAKSAGGTTIGILPGRSSKEANQYVDIPIVTTVGFARNVIVVNTGDAASGPYAHPFSQQRENPLGIFKARGVVAEWRSMTRRERGAAVFTAVALNLGSASGAEPLDRLVLAFRTGHDRPLA